MKRRMLTIVLAGLLAVLGAIAVLAYVGQANKRALEGQKPVLVLAAAGAIRAGTSLGTANGDHLLKTEKVPASSLSANLDPVTAVTPANRQLVMSADVAKGQLLSRDLLVSAGTVTASGSFSIPAGMVAVTVQMCVPEAVANYVSAGSDVAVFDTYANGKGSQVSRSCDLTHTVINSGAITNPGLVVTHVVLAKAEVLAVGENPGAQSTSAGGASTVMDPSSSASPAQGSVLVTLAVNQADAERLILIDELGLPYMALLGPTSKTAFDFSNHVYLFRG